MSASWSPVVKENGEVLSVASRSAGGVDVSRSSTALVVALVQETRRRPHGVARRALSALRKARLLAGDPAVVVEFDGQELALPLSHDLPIHRARYPDYSRNLGRVVSALHDVQPGAPVVDIGANVGDSVAIMRAQVPAVPILCIEGDAQFLPYLHRNLSGLTGVEVAPVYVLHTAERDSRSMTVIRAGGTASLVERVAAEPHDAVTTQSLARILADHPRFARPGLLKLDTDGHDADILLQAESVLGDAMPVVYFEFDPPMAAAVGGTDPHDALDLLATIGYRRALVFANTGALVAVLDGDGWVLTLAELASALGPDRAVAYFDVCVFGPTDLAIADAVAHGELTRT